MNDEYPQTGNFDNGPEDGELEQDDHDELEKEMKEWHLDEMPSRIAFPPELARFHYETHLCLHGKREHCDECDIINFHVPVLAAAATSKGDGEARENTTRNPARPERKQQSAETDSCGVENPLLWVNNQLAKYFDSEDDYYK